MNQFEQAIMRKVYSWRITQAFSLTEEEFQTYFLNNWEEPEDFSESFQKVLYSSLSEEEYTVLFKHYQFGITDTPVPEIFPGCNSKRIHQHERNALIRLSRTENWDRMMKGDKALQEWEDTIKRLSRSRQVSEKTVQELGLSKKLLRILKKSNCNTLDELMQYNSLEWIDRFGTSFLKEAINAIANEGYDTTRMRKAFNLA